MATAMKYQGLCSTCVHSVTCVYPRDVDRSILCCDEFCGEQLPCPVKVISSKSLLGSNPGFLTESDEAVQGCRGLCRTCEKRPTCTFPKGAGGVWHCEEYQ